MTHRSLNLAQFWLTVAFLLVPSISFTIAAYWRFEVSGFNDIGTTPSA